MREIHELPYQSGVKEKFFSLGPISLSLDESGWVFAGVIISYQMPNYIPTIGSSFPWSYLHYAIPVLVCYFLSKAKHPRTGIPLISWIGRFIAIRRRDRAFYYRRVNVVKGGDRHY